MSGKFVVSLDFELMWGVRDKRSIDDFGNNILGARIAIIEMLNLFDEYGIHVTWATVGLLFAENKDEMLEFYPKVKPSYDCNQFCPYSYLLNSVGKSEKEDPYHFAYSLINRIVDTPFQEIATHTYSHYYCLESGQTIEQFECDLTSALDIADSKGITVKSIVFPRNQSSSEYISVCKNLGLLSYRGNPDSSIYQEKSQENRNQFVRGLRLLDSVLPVDGYHGSSLSKDFGITNIKSSRFLRPISAKAPAIVSALQYYRIIFEMRHAAKNGLVYHLWWHPHNFGLNTAVNIANLKCILLEFKKLEDEFGMESLSMSELS